MFSFIQAQEIEFKEINSVQGLSHSTVYDITQDQEGFMWFGTREGLNRYDGYEIKTYYSSEKSTDSTSLPDNEILTLLSTERGLFIGTRNGLSRYQPEYDSFRSSFNGKKIEGSIQMLYEAENQKVFIGTKNALYTLSKQNNIKRILNQVPVRAFCNYKKNVYWLALNTEVWLINASGEVIKKYNIPPESSDTHTSFVINCLYKDLDNKVWMGTSKGLYYFDEIRDNFIYKSVVKGNEIEANVVRAISQDHKGKLWLGTESGLFIFDKSSGKSEHYTQSFDEKRISLSDKSVYSLFINNEGITWIGTYFGGVNYTPPSGRGFKKLYPGTNNKSLRGKAVSQIIETKKSNIWIATEDGGINVWNPRKNKFSYLDTKDGLSSNNIHSLLEDHQGNIWIGTFLGGLNKYDPDTRRIKSFSHQNNDSSSISNNYVYSILQSTDGKLWIGTQYGLNIFDPEAEKFSLFKPETFGDKFIYDMLEDAHRNLWICTRTSGIYRYDEINNKISHYSAPAEITSNQVISVTETSDGELWFGTLNGGLLRWNSESNSFRDYSKSDILPNNNVYAIVEGSENELWITTNKGLTRFNTTKDSATIFTTQDGLNSNQFNFKSGFKDKSGRLYFGSINGLTYFHPDSLKNNLPVPEIRFIGFKLFNKDVPVQENGILKKQINFTDSITLENDQNVITFEFAALNYQTGNNYAYFLDGFEKNWNKVGDKRTATYTNLSPGDYTFRVQTLPLGTKNERRIHLSILPPFWKTIWAYTLYFLLLLALVYAYWRFVRFIHDQKLAVHLEQMEKEKIKEVNQHKLNFFTFISHEFKTPLTLIIASVDKYIRKSQASHLHSHELNAIKKSAGKLQHLIRQLMEFRKIETSHVKLELKKGDIILFLKDTFNAFGLLMEEKNLGFSCKSDIPEYKCYFDPDKLEMIVTNLISNAIKNTPEEGEIDFKIDISTQLDEHNRSMLKLQIQDTGLGMTPEEVSRIFDPFFKSGKSENLNGWKSGSGIGLALVKNLTDLLDGKIFVRSAKGKGTHIEVKLPVRLKPENLEDPVSIIEGNKDLSIDMDMLGEEQISSEEEFVKELPQGMSLLIVEDNSQIIKFLKEHFSGRFKVITARNGIQALEKLKNHVPDIIISDLIMAEMDGISLCKRIKSDPKTNHIPFLLLTGKTERSYRMEGLRVGANAFINKPFSIHELDLLIKNLLETNQNRANRFEGIEVESLKSFPKNNQNREFLKKINDLVSTNYNDPKFSIESLASMMGISRSLLHIKMKKATGASASEYLKSIRLQKAAEMIRQGKPISEVAYKVGYNDPNYFSRVFKKEFKVSPSNYNK